MPSDSIFYAHSLQDRDKGCWQPLAEHLLAVAEAAGARGEKFGARNSAALAGLLHDLGKYSAAFQRRLEGGEERVDHSTAGAQEAVRLAAATDNRIIAQIIAHAVAGHHAGLPDTLGGDASLDARLKRDTEALDSWWRQEISPTATGLMPMAIDWCDKRSVAYRLAFFGRMLFSCLVDADFRDTETFYRKAEGRGVDRQWPKSPDILGDLREQFDAHMARLTASARATPVNAFPTRLRLETTGHY